jgi:hypothetical protein
MADVDLQLTREFFELHLFRVLTNWQQSPLRDRSPDHGPQLFIENTHPLPRADELPLLLRRDEVGGLVRAVVEVRAWHADRLYPSTIESNPVLIQFVEPEALALAADVFGTDDFARVLVVSELPASAEPRRRALELVRAAGVTHLIEFPTVLQGLVERVQEGGTYAGSPTLQTLRLLKRYRLLRNQQMEFLFPIEPEPLHPLPAMEDLPPPEPPAPE